MHAASTEPIELSSSGSDSDVTLGGSSVKLRPKLRTRRSQVAHQSDTQASDSPDVDPPAKRVRKASKPIQVRNFMFFLFI